MFIEEFCEHAGAHYFIFLEKKKKLLHILNIDERAFIH